MVDIRPLTADYAVAPQIDPGDLPAIRAAGYVTVIDNRPDGEIPESHRAEPMRAAAEAEGLSFVVNPILPGSLTDDNLSAQAAAMAAAAGPVLAYCASGNRSSIVWAFVMAGQGKTPAEEIVALAARHGYQLAHLQPQLAAMAARKG